MSEAIYDSENRDSQKVSQWNKKFTES